MGSAPAGAALLSPSPGITFLRGAADYAPAPRANAAAAPQCSLLPRAGAGYMASSRAEAQAGPWRGGDANEIPFAVYLAVLGD